MSDSTKKFYGTHWTKMPNADEIRARIVASKKKNPNRFWLGKTLPEATKAKISASKKNSPKTRFGADHHNWNGGVAGEHGRIRNSMEYKLWRDAVYLRDKWTCCECGSKKALVAHHIKTFSEHPELRFSVENGKTLCRSCHMIVHNPAKGKIRRIAA